MVDELRTFSLLSLLDELETGSGYWPGWEEEWGEDVADGVACCTVDDVAPSGFLIFLNGSMLIDVQLH